MPTPPVHEFEVLPVEPADFAPFVLDVPTLGTAEQAARRAYFSAMAYLAPRGFDVEEFEVREFCHPYRHVGPGGFGAEVAS